MQHLTRICAVLLLVSLAYGCPAETKRNEISQDHVLVLKHARDLRAAHRLEAATALLHTYTTAHADDAEAITLLAEIRLEAGDPAEGKRLLVQALTADPKLPEANLAAGKLLMSEQQYPEAMDRFETVLQDTPGNAAARDLERQAVTALASSAVQAGKGEAALEALEHARAKMPGDSRLLMEVGLQALDLKLYAEADAALAEARQVAPNDADVVYASARLALEEQHMPQAEADLRAYLAARPNDASGHFGLGHVLAMEQRDEDAKKEFVRSTQLQPAQTESYYQIGQLDLNAHRDEEASAMFAKVIARDSKHGGALVGLGEIAFHAKNYAQAEQYLRRATASAPNYGPGHYYLGLTLARLGRKDEADQELKIATDLGKAAAAPVHGATPAPQP